MKQGLRTAIVVGTLAGILGFGAGNATRSTPARSAIPYGERLAIFDEETKLWEARRNPMAHDMARSAFSVAYSVCIHGSPPEEAQGFLELDYAEHLSALCGWRDDAQESFAWQEFREQTMHLQKTPDVAAPIYREE